MKPAQINSKRLSTQRECETEWGREREGGWWERMEREVGWDRVESDSVAWGERGFCLVQLNLTLPPWVQVRGPVDTWPCARGEKTHTQTHTPISSHACFSFVTLMSLAGTHTHTQTHTHTHCTLQRWSIQRWTWLHLKGGDEWGK